MASDASRAAAGAAAGIGNSGRQMVPLQFPLAKVGQVGAYVSVAGNNKQRVYFGPYRPGQQIIDALYVYLFTDAAALAAGLMSIEPKAFAYKPGDDTNEFAANGRSLVVAGTKPMIQTLGVSTFIIPLAFVPDLDEQYLGVEFSNAAGGSIATGSVWVGIRVVAD